jgi:hypothetical protein
MRRATMDSIAEEFSNLMIIQTMNGNHKSPEEWAREFNRLYPHLGSEGTRRVTNKVVRILKAAGNPNDANM